MANTATITISVQPNGFFQASVDPATITADDSKNVKITISDDSPDWTFFEVPVAPTKAEGWHNVGLGVFIENGEDFTLKSDSTNREVKLKDSGKDKGDHPQHHYLCCITNGTASINTDPIIIDKSGIG